MKKNQPQPYVIRDAKTFYSTIKANPLYDGVSDADVIATLESYFQPRVSAANGDNLMGTARDSYMFYQGMLGGLLIAYKQMKHHMEATANEQNVNPYTGESYAPKGN